MRYVLDISDDDNYKISGYFDDKTIKELKHVFKATETKRNTVSVSGDYDPVEVFRVFMNSEDIDISYNFSDYNDFIGSKVLENLFNIAYTDKEFSPSQINTLQNSLAQLIRQLPDQYSKSGYPEIQLEDDYFLACLDEFASKFSKRTSIDWYTFYRLIEDKTGNRESLRQIAKILFMINFAKNVSKAYVAFVLSKFNVTPAVNNNALLERLEVLAELEKLNKKDKDSILLHKTKEREKLRKLMRAIGVSSPSPVRKSSGKIIYKIKDGKVVAMLSESDSESSSD